MHRSMRPMATGLLLAPALACTRDKDIVRLPDRSNGLLNSYVALGNSITAGFQSGGINDSTQRESYAFFLAKAAGARYAYPSLLVPGCPPPIVNALTQQRLANVPCAGRDLTKAATTINNVAVPGATALDPVADTGTAASNALTTFILGGKTQVQRALENNPTFATLWIGNNDVLGAALSGLPVRATPLPRFTSRYANDLAALISGAPSLKGGVLIGVVNAAFVPLLFPAAAFQNPAFKAGFDQLAGQTTTLDPSCLTPPGAAALFNLQLAGEIRFGRQPPTLICTATTFAGPGDIYVLDVSEQATISNLVAAYNAYIRAKADSIGFAYFDPNPVLAALKQDPSKVSTVPNLASPIQTFGTYISLDGVHPSRLAHETLADSLISVINRKYSTNLALLPVQ